MGMGTSRASWKRFRPRTPATSPEDRKQPEGKAVHAGTLLLQFSADREGGAPRQGDEMIPGFSRLINVDEADNAAIRRSKAIIQSMTPAERRNPRSSRGRAGVDRKVDVRAGTCWAVRADAKALQDLSAAGDSSSSAPLRQDGWHSLRGPAPAGDRFRCPLGSPRFSGGVLRNGSEDLFVALGQKESPYYRLVL